MYVAVRASHKITRRVILATLLRVQIIQYEAVETA